MKRKIIFVFLAIAFFLCGCKKEDNTAFTDWPILESYLKPGDYFNLKISRQVPFFTSVKYSSDSLNQLIIKVLHNNKTDTLSPCGNGEYTDSSLVVAEGEEYHISFSFNSKVVSAYTNVPAKPSKFTQSATTISLSKRDSSSVPPTMTTMPDPVKLSWTNNDASYYLVVIENIESSPEAIFNFGTKTPPGNRFRKQPVTSSGLEIRSQEFQYFGTHRLILFHVLPDYANLYNQSGTSSQNLTNPASSISNGYGIFTGLNSDTLYIEVKKL